MALKIVIIGGGSYTWTHRLVVDLLLQPGLEDGGELWLVDIDPQALSDMAGYCRALFRHVNAPFTLHATTKLAEALPGADFVIITVTTGGLEAMRADLEIPVKYGIVQPVGDTVGPGGIARALRNVPVFEEFAQKIMRYCPQAWVLNITNPMTVLTQVLGQGGCKAVGLCHELYILWGQMREQLGCDWHDIDLTVAGLNHFSFFLKATHRGQDCFDLFHTWANDPKYRMLQPDVPVSHQETHGKHLFKFEYFRQTGRMLYPGDRHTSEFFHNVIAGGNGHLTSYNIALTPVATRYQWLDSYKEKVQNWTRHPETIELKASREAVAGLIQTLAHGGRLREVVNLPNAGQIENLPRGVVVETMGTITGDQIAPDIVGRLPDDLAALMYPHCCRFNLTIEAALKGDRQLAAEALRSDPLVRDWRSTDALLNEMLEANRKYLPRFFNGKGMAGAARVNEEGMAERRSIQCLENIA